MLIGFPKKGKKEAEMEITVYLEMRGNQSTT